MRSKTLSYNFDRDENKMVKSEQPTVKKSLSVKAPEVEDQYTNLYQNNEVEDYDDLIDAEIQESKDDESKIMEKNKSEATTNESKTTENKGKTTETKSRYSGEVDEYKPRINSPSQMKSRKVKSNNVDSHIQSVKPNTSKSLF